jgi:hypothetical protein
MEEYIALEENCLGFCEDPTVDTEYSDGPCITVYNGDKVIYLRPVSAGTREKASRLTMTRISAGNSKKGKTLDELECVSWA